METVVLIPSLTSSVSETLYQFQQQRYLCDVLIFTSDGYIPAHRVVLVAASKHFRDIESSRNIHTTPEANFYLTEEKSEDMQKIVQLIYTGELKISMETVKRIYNLCQTLGLEDAMNECQKFISENGGVIDNNNKTVILENKENDLSLKQLETAVISQLEMSRSNCSSLATTSSTSNDIKDDKNDMIYETNTNISETMAENQIKIDKKSKGKGQKGKNKRLELNENNAPEQTTQGPNINEKIINCSLCKEKFQDKKQLMEHRRIRHSNKRKPMHTKRYIPTPETNETITDIEEPVNLEDDTVSCDNTSFDVEDDNNVLSTRQGTKRRSVENMTKSKKNGRFICRLCKDEFTSNDLLQEHRKLIHPGGKRENLTCQLCDKVLSTWLNLIEHKYKKHNIGYDMEKYQVIMCEMPDCDFSTIVEYKMKTHYNDVHGEVGSYICEICNKGCKSAPQLKYHMKTVHPDDKTPLLYKCDHCSKTFRHSCNLKKHIDYVHLKISDKKYLCHLCTYKCMSKTDLNNHLLKIHDIPLPKSCKVYNCEKCDYFTLTRSCYERHQQLHEGEGLQKTFMCSTCGKGFSNIQNVKAHEKRHNSEILCCPFESCGYSTKFKHTMKNHIAGMHTHKNVRPYQCHLCEYSCKLKGNLDKHLRGKHGVEVMTIPKLRQKAIETGKGFSEIVFPPRNCNELPAKLADKHQLQTTQKSQELQDVSFPELFEMAKRVSKEVSLQSQTEGDLQSQNSEFTSSRIIGMEKEGNLDEHYRETQNPEVITEIHYHESLTPTPVAMETEGPSYRDEQDIALSNLNPVPMSVSGIRHSKDSSYSNDQNSIYLNQSVENSFSARPLPAHIPQSHSSESYAAMLSSFFTSKAPSHLSTQQPLQSLLPLNMQNYQSNSQHHPLILNHILSQMEEAGYSTLGRPTSVPSDESYQTQVRPQSVENVSYRNLSYQGEGTYSTNMSSSEDSPHYHQEPRCHTSLEHQPSSSQRNIYSNSQDFNSEIIIQPSVDAGSQNRQLSPSNNSSTEKSPPKNLHGSEEEEYQDIAQLAYNQA